MSTDDDRTSAGRAFELNRRLRGGVNIIGYDPIWRDGSGARMQDRHFRLIKEAGFEHVRVNLHPFAHMESAPRFHIGEGWLKTLDWAVDRALSNDLAVVLDMHEFGAMGDDPVGNHDRYLATWEQLAQRYRGLPETVCFELLNEPCRALTPVLWNQYLLEAHAIVRESNPDRVVIIGPAFWNGIDHLDELMLPEDDTAIIATVHYYRPMEFTHQGAPWSSFQDYVGTEWHATPEEQHAIIADFTRAEAWAEAHHRPLYLGEFGAYDRADMPSRARYTHFVARLAEASGWSWAYWQFDSDFIVYDIDNDVWVAPIRDALIPPQN